MASPPSIGRLAVDSIGDQLPDWFQSLLTPLNQFMGQTQDALSAKLTRKDNMLSAVRNVTFNTTLTLTGVVGTAFSYTVPATNNPTSWSATSLPAGLTIAAGTGIISGTPTTSGLSTVSVTATNAQGTATCQIQIQINPIQAATVPAFTDAVPGGKTNSNSVLVRVANDLNVPPYSVVVCQLTCHAAGAVQTPAWSYTWRMNAANQIEITFAGLFINCPYSCTVVTEG